MKNGNICNVETSQGVVGPAIAWVAAENVNDDVVQTSKQLQELYDLKLESKITVAPSNESFVDATRITLCEVSTDDSETLPSSLDQKKSLGWAWLLEERLTGAEMLTPGMVLANVNADGIKKSFQIKQVNSSEARLPYRVHSCE